MCKTKKEDTARRKKVCEYIKRYQKKFKLGNYRYTIRFVSGEKWIGYYAQVSISGNRVRLWINEDLMKLDPNETENTVVHELLHVVLYKITKKSTDIITQYVRKEKVRNKLERKVEDLEHDIIDRLTPAFTSDGKKRYQSKNKHKGES